MVVGEFTQEAELVVIGGGPGGYTAAFRAAELGVSTVIVDPGAALGGVCLHAGCIPSKTLLNLAETIDRAAHAGTSGVHFGAPTIDLDGVRGWTERTIGTLARGLDGLCRKHGVERIAGRARFESSRSMSVVGGTVPRIHFRRAVIATGSRPRPHPALDFDGTRVLQPDEAVRLRALPATLLVIGDTYVAVEVASIYASLGSSVTLVTESDDLLPATDPDLARPLVRALDTRLHGVHTGVSIAATEVTDGGVSVTFGGSGAPDAAVFDCVVTAADRIPNTDELGLELTRVETDRAGYLTVDDHLRTTDPRIFAVGDVTAGPPLAHKAIHQARVCGEALAGWGSAYEPRTVPWAVFTDPQIAWCGLTQREAEQRSIRHRIVKTPWGASGRAVGMGRPEGLTKMLYEPDTGLVLGVGLVGPNATEMIAEAALAIEMGAVTADLAATVHPHPTICELLGSASQQADTAAETGAEAGA